MAGAFQTNRDIFANPIWKNIVEFRLFFLIYGNAVYSDEGVRLADDLVLKRGEWCRSTRKIQEDLQYIENRQVKTYSTSVINRCIKKLERSQRICTRTHDLGTVFTVVNYEQYQGFGGFKKDNLEHNLEQCWNSVGTVAEQQRNNNKKVNKDNKEKNISTTTDESEISVMNAFTKSFGLLIMPATIREYVKKLKESQTDEMITELMLEVGESSTKPNLRFLQAVGDRWVAEGITSREQAKGMKESLRPAQKTVSFDNRNRSSKPHIPIVESTVDAQPPSEEELAELMKLAEQMKASKKEAEYGSKESA